MLSCSSSSRLFVTTQQDTAVDSIIGRMITGNRLPMSVISEMIINEKTIDLLKQCVTTEYVNSTRLTWDQYTELFGVLDTLHEAYKTWQVLP
jgi:hypothetical protein